MCKLNKDEQMMMEACVFLSGTEKNIYTCGQVGGRSATDFRVLCKCRFSRNTGLS
jgi:hypothetical protein